MKAIRGFLVGFSLGAALFLGGWLVFAQSDTPPLPASELPDTGNFYSAQNPDWPPLPGNVLGLSAWPLGDGLFLLDDLEVDYSELQSEAALLQAMGLEEEESGGSMMSMAMFNNGSSSWGWPVYLTNLVATPLDSSVTATFSIAGGTNYVPYDIWMTTNLANKISESQWIWLGVGYTSNSYTFTNQPYDAAFYALARPQNTMVLAWGNNADGQCDVPSGLSNAVAVTGGYGQSLALLNDGTVVAWGLDDVGQGSVPTNVVGAVMIASGWYHNVALLTNGTVIAWGYDFSTWHLLEVPADLTNATIISAQSLHSLALRADGTVVAWGYSTLHGETNVPSGLSNVVAIAAGGQHNLAVKADGTVVAWGDNSSNQCNVPAGLSNVVDVAAGWAHSVALKADGTVVAWGDNTFAETNVPAGLSNVVAIAANGDPYLDTAYSMALRSDGTVVGWGDGEVFNSVSGLNHVIAIGGGVDYGLAVRSGPLTPVIVQQPTDQFQVAGGTATFTVESLPVAGTQYQWQFNGVDISGKTNATLALTNVQATNEGAYQVTVSNTIGSTISLNANFHLVTPPVIISQTLPTNQTVPYLTNVTLTVVATAPGQSNGFPLGYQWQFYGTNIVGANVASNTFIANADSAGAYSVIVTNAAGSTSAVWQVTVDYTSTYIAPGTLAHHLSTNAVGYASGLIGSSNDMMLLSGWTFATYSDTNMNMGLLTNAIWSTNCWVKGVKGLSATPIGMIDNPGGQTLFTMVSPRHYLLAGHTVRNSGTLVVVAFLDTNNVIYWRTNVEAIKVPASFSGGVPNDMAVGILNADLPTSVGYLPVLPPDYENYLPTNYTDFVQGIGMNQHMKVFGSPMNFGPPFFAAWNPDVTCPFGLGINWNVPLDHGDSSLPERLLIGNQLVFVAPHSGTLSGPDAGIFFNVINQYMHYLSTNNNAGTDYQLTPFSLTNWPTIR